LDWPWARAFVDLELRRLESLHAPHLLDLEVVQVLRRYAASGALSGERALLALQDLSALDLERYPHEPLLGRIWQLRKKMSAYDAAYVALAEALDAPLLTFDARLATPQLKRGW